MLSLLDAAVAGTAPTILPPLSERRPDGSWPIAAMPLEQIAEDLARAGVCYEPGAWSIEGTWKIDEYDVAAMVARVLRHAGDAVHHPIPPSKVFALARVRADDVWRDTHDAALALLPDAESDVYQLAEKIASPELQRALLAFRAEMRGDPAYIGLLALDAAHAEASADEARVDLARALRRTADSLSSPRARRELTRALAERLPAPEYPVPALDVVDDFLAQFDVERHVRRSAVVAAYVAADRPGGMDDTALRARATDRWGAVVKVQGHLSYRPAASRACSPS